MNEEKRFLLALSLALGILLVWSALVPSPKVQEVPGSAVKPQATLEPQTSTATLTAAPAAEPLFRTALGPVSLGVGVQRGGIRLLDVDGAELLVESNPGLLQVDLKTPAHSPLSFQTGQENGTLVSRAALETPPTEIERRISLVDDGHNFLINCKLNIKNRSYEKQEYLIRMVAYQPIHVKEIQDRRYQEGLLSVNQEMVIRTHHLRLKPGQAKDFPGVPLWVTAQGKSHALILRPDGPPLSGKFHVEHPANGITTGWLELPLTLPAGGQSQWSFTLYAGPMTLANLKAAGMEDAISFGLFSGIAKILLNVLTWSRGWLGNYGLAIIFVSVAIWLLFFPVTWSGVRTMKVMSQLQPQMERLRREHAKNPQRMNQEMLELYKKHRVNPLSGCLPLFLQMPIFISLFQVLTRSAQLRGAGFLWMKDLSAPDALIRFQSPVPILGNNLNILPILMMIAMFVQQKMTQPSQAVLSDEQAVQQKMMRWFPLLFGFLFYGLPSGLVLYWVTNTVLTLIQQKLALGIHRG